MRAEWGQLADRGWTLVEGVADSTDAEELLTELGELLPQYGGRLRHEVTYRPGFDDVLYSQSANGLTPHTDAPGRDPPPRYLGLHCHRQARCGGGATVLADGRRLLETVGAELAAEARRRKVRFDLVEGTAINDEPAVAAPVFDESADGRLILRYWYSVMRDGRKRAPVRTGADDLAGVEAFFAELCRAGSALAESEGQPVLAPDASLLVADNWRMIHSRTAFTDRRRHLSRYWVG
jgi:alpha-ketoglutarate-dependent taurine dioxygenase